jgi:hypothetical protein
VQVRCALYNGTLGSGFGQKFDPANIYIPENGPSFDRRLFVPLDIRAVDALDALRAEREYQVVRRTGMMRLAFPP